jgi:hypothetical protein
MSGRPGQREADFKIWGVLSDWTLRRFAIVGAVGILGCMIARAPTLLGKVNVAGIDLNLNAGYVLVLGPLLLLIGIVWAASGVSRPFRISGKSGLAPGVIMTVPVLSAGFIVLQFFLLLAPKGECLTFDRWRYLFDFSLRAFQPEYCMGASDEVQRSLPWLLNPPIVQGWMQLAFPIVGAVITSRAVQRWYSEKR